MGICAQELIIVTTVSYPHKYTAPHSYKYAHICTRMQTYTHTRRDSTEITSNTTISHTHMSSVLTHHTRRYTPHTPSHKPTCAHIRLERTSQIIAIEPQLREVGEGSDTGGDLACHVRRMSCRRPHCECCRKTRLGSATCMPHLAADSAPGSVQ